MCRGGARALDRSWARGRPFARRRNGGRRRRRLRARERRAGPAGDGIEVEVVPENGRLSVAVTFFDPLSGENAYPPFLARPVDEREFEVVDADRRGERLTFPRD